MIYLCNQTHCLHWFWHWWKIYTMEICENLQQDNKRFVFFPFISTLPSSLGLSSSSYSTITIILTLFGADINHSLTSFYYILRQNKCLVKYRHHHWTKGVPKRRITSTEYTPHVIYHPPSYPISLLLGSDGIKYTFRQNSIDIACQHQQRLYT